MNKNKIFIYFFVLFFSFSISPSKSFFINEEEAQKINSYLSKRKTVKIFLKEENLYQPKSLFGVIKVDDEEIYSVYIGPISDANATTITFKKGAPIVWNSDGVLDVFNNRVGGDIVFEEGASIKNAGNGGLKLCSSEGIIKFPSAETQIDFEESQGAICILYNPPGELYKKYLTYNQCYKYFDKNIKRNNNVLCNSFMLITNPNELRAMSRNPQGNYSLLHDIKDDNFLSYYEIIYSKQASPFKGSFHFNGAKLIGPELKPDSCKVSFVFENHLLQEENWAANILFMVPPLKPQQKNLLHFLKLRKETEANDCIREIFSGDSDHLWRAGRLAFYDGIKKNTPLHIAAKKGLVESLTYMLSEIFSPFRPDQNSPYLKRNPFSLLGRKNNKGLRPIDLAVQCGQTDTAKVIINYYTVYKLQYLLRKEMLLSLIGQQQEQAQPMRRLLDEFEDPPVPFSVTLQGFPNKNEALKNEYSHQLGAGQKFFMRRPETHKTKKIFNDFEEKYKIENIQGLKENEKERYFPTYDLTGLSSRSRIILLQAIKNKKLKTFNSEKMSYYWKKYEEKTEDDIPYFKYSDCFPITYQCGELTYKIRNQPSEKKPGHAYCYEIEAYEAICIIVSAIEQRISGEKIAKIFKQSRLTGRNISAKMLEDEGYQTSGNSSSKEDAEYLNRLLFLIDLEVVFRLVDASQSYWDCLPVASANARAFSLQQRKKITLLDLLDKSSKYHPFTDNNNYSQREMAIKKLNEKFHEEATEDDKLLNAKLTSKIKEWRKLHPGGFIIKTPEGLHQELLEEYGGECESSGEEYTFL